MIKILISACLLGEKVRYDGQHNLIRDDFLTTLSEKGYLIPFCPEVAGGLPIPRVPCEKDVKTQKIITQSGDDMTEFFESGAQKALNIVKQHQVSYAIMKEKSPSCGVNHIYDGSFKRQLIAGMGHTVQVLRDNGVEVFSEKELPLLQAKLNQVR